MIYRQKGFLPRLTFIIGLLVMGLFTLILIVFLLNSLPVLLLEPLGPAAYLRVIMVSLFLIILAFQGYIVMSIFPSIQITEAGLVYRSLFFTRRVPWEDMVSLLNARWPKEAKALVFFPQSDRNLLRYFVNTSLRLYPNQIHGAISGVHEPTVILSKGLEQRDAVISAFQAHLQKQNRESELVARATTRNKSS